MKRAFTTRQQKRSATKYFCHFDWTGKSNAIWKQEGKRVWYFRANVGFIISGFNKNNIGLFRKEITFEEAKRINSLIT